MAFGNLSRGRRKHYGESKSGFEDFIRRVSIASKERSLSTYQATGMGVAVRLHLCIVPQNGRSEQLKLEKTEVVAWPTAVDSTSIHIALQIIFGISRAIMRSSLLLSFRRSSIGTRYDTNLRTACRGSSRFGVEVCMSRLRLRHAFMLTHPTITSVYILT